MHTLFRNENAAPWPSWSLFGGTAPHREGCGSWRQRSTWRECDGGLRLARHCFFNEDNVGRQLAVLINCAAVALKGQGIFMEMQKAKQKEAQG